MCDNRYTALSTWMGNRLGNGGGSFLPMTLDDAFGLVVSTLVPAGRTLLRENKDDKLPNFRPDADTIDSLGIGKGDRVVGGLGDNTASAGGSSNTSGLGEGSGLFRFIL